MTIDRIVFAVAGSLVLLSVVLTLAVSPWTNGKVVVPALNALHIDLAIPGNWEVVYGIPALVERSRELNYPIVVDGR